MSSMAEKIQELLAGDPLFQVIRDTPMEEVLYTDAYLPEIIEKKYYSTPEVSSWFDISDAQLRYYIKPFEPYVFATPEETPMTPTLIRLNFLAILKLRMILLLKDEYRVKGLKRLLGIDENGHVIKQVQQAATTEVVVHEDLSEKVDLLSNIVNQVLQSGLFELQQQDENGEAKIIVNQDLFIKPLPQNSVEQIEKIQAKTEQLIEDNDTLKMQIQEIKENHVKDVAIRMREKYIEQEVVAILRTEGFNEFSKQKSFGLFKKLFHFSEIEMEKERFIAEYLNEHLAFRLETALTKYYEAN